RTQEETRRRLAQQEAGRTLAEGLAKTRSGFIARLNAFVGASKDLDDAALAELEEILFSADVGVHTATALLESVRERLKRRELSDAVTRARGEKLDVVLCDTAGRLHTKPNLMEELKRLKRTLSKAQEGAPHEVLLVVDATTGQNAIQQARQFHDSLGVTGFVLTKLDGTAKGGVIIGICDALKIPVRYVGIGEKVNDLKEFDAHEFVEALFAE